MFLSKLAEVSKKMHVLRQILIQKGKMFDAFDMDYSGLSCIKNVRSALKKNKKKKKQKTIKRKR